MKVAIVTESFLPSINGVTNSVLRVIDTLLQEGHELLVIAPTSEGPSYRGVPVIKSPAVVLSGFPVAIPTPLISAALDRFGPDVIHVAAPFWLGGEAIAYGHRRGIPTVAIYQTDVAGYMKRYGLDFATTTSLRLSTWLRRRTELTDFSRSASRVLQCGGVVLTSSCFRPGGETPLPFRSSVASGRPTASALWATWVDWHPRSRLAA
jgi:phosphatidylinositol alpha 1,6-mannosyltransferase